MVGFSTELRLSSLLPNFLQTDDDQAVELPQQVKNFLRDHDIDDRVETPEDLRQLMRTLNQTGGDLNGLPRPDFQNLGSLSAQDMTQMLVDWIQSGGPEANKKIQRPAPIGSLSSPSNFTSAPTDWSGGGGSTGGTTAGSPGGTVAPAATGGTQAQPNATGGGDSKKTFTSKEDQTAGFIDDRLKTDTGQDFVAAGKKYDVDPLVLAAMSEHDADGGDALEGPMLIDTLQSPRGDVMEDAREFARLRERGGASANDPIQEQLQAVNSARGTNQDNWLQGVSDRYQDIKPAAKTFAKEHPVLDTNTVQGAAQALLDNPNVSFWSDLSSGSDRAALEQIAKTGKSTVPQTGETVTPNLEMMQALVEMAKQGPIMINALTGGEHSVGSNHYTGNAVDLDIGVGDAAQIEAIANQFGGTRNSETDHIHLDFV
jgi:hypothetical protein